MEGFNFILDAAVIFYGCRALYTWLRLVREKTLVDSTLICPKDLHPSDCRDTTAYYKYITSRLIIFGVLSVFFGTSNIIFSSISVPSQPILLSLSTVGIVLSILFFCRILSKSAKQYW